MKNLNICLKNNKRGARQEARKAINKPPPAATVKPVPGSIYGKNIVNTLTYWQCLDKV
ncbi:hypothetical protein ACFL96_19200 [Thermoproteota archaeon]